MLTVRSIYDAKIADGLQHDPSQETIVAELDLLANELRQQATLFSRLAPWGQKQPGGLYVWGDVGRGKSMLADALIEAVPDIAARRTHFHAFMRDIHRALHAARLGKNADPISAAADKVTNGLALLVLDELEITDIVDAMIVGRVFEKVFARGVAVVTTSNRPPSALYQDGLKRELFVPFVQLVENRMVVIQLDGDTDYRRGGARETVQNENMAFQRADSVWRNTSVDNEKVLAVGRNARLRHRGEIVRASFDTLCRNPLTASDYIDLAKIAKICLIDEMPRLGERDNDAVRRFILLADTLYDAGCTLIINAEMKPEDLYAEGAFEQEFRRTVSRLYQMARTDWPANAPLR